MTNGDLGSWLDMHAITAENDPNQVFHSLEPERQDPPGTERSRKCRARRLAAGQCQVCGQKRGERYKYRCASCQQKERLRWRRAYAHNFGWFHEPERRALYSEY